MKVEKINLMIPTFKRVQSGMLPRCIQSFVQTVSEIQNIVFTFLVNYKDEETIDYLSSTTDIDCGYKIMLVYYDRPHIGWFYNTLYDLTPYQDPEFAVTLIGDDMVCKTKNWDVKIIDALNTIEGKGIVHCRDGIQNGQIAVNLFTTRKWVNLTGGKFMENFPVDMIDVVYTEVARRTGHEIYLNDVFIEHQHSSLKPKAEWDEGFRGLRAEYDKYGPEISGQVESCISKQMRNVLGY